MELANLRCEYFVNPLGIDTLKPRLSWELRSDERGQKQTAYQILVGSSPEAAGELWDSGKVESDQSFQVEYAGTALRSGLRCYWKVKVWDARGVASAWSQPAYWEMGLLDPADWKAQWIGSELERFPCPMSRRQFQLEKPVRRARLYVTARGLYEMSVNGQRVGDDHFSPGWTDYDVRVQYQTYDVTASLRQGDNVLGALLGGGWFCGWRAKPGDGRDQGAPPKLLAQLLIENADGTSRMVCSDASWKLSDSPILESSLYDGETYDARLEQPGWDAPGFDDHSWRAATVHPPTAAVLVASASPTVREIEELKPLAMTEPTPGAFVFDLGQNMVGWARLRVQGPAGTAVALRFAETLNPDGSIYTTNLRSAKCLDTYILKGQGVETFEPRFTFHGFRYVELSGCVPALDSVTGVVLHSDMTPAGSFECSSPLLNQLQRNILWGQKGNFLDVPTDCPQRDERLGWTGDAQVFARTACFNMDVAGFFNKWLVDLTDAQAPSGAFPMIAPDMWGKKQGDGGAGWADAGIICPWTLYRCYGDIRVLERHYGSMVRYMDHLDNVDWCERHCFGDWLNQNDRTPNDLIGMAFHAYCASLMVEVADALGKAAAAARWREVFEAVRTRFNYEFVTPSGRLAGDSQAAYVLALHFKLLPEGLRVAAAENLVARIRECKTHLSTGFLGTPYLLFALLDAGHLDVAYELLLNEDFPSWLYPVKQGATTIWERWDGWRHDKGFQDPGMNSFNHYAYGAVGDWLYRVVAGLDAAAPGYKQVELRPCPGGGITHAAAKYRSMSGEIVSSWRIEDGKFVWDIVLPPGTTGVAHVPAKSAAAVTGGGNLLRRGDGRAVFALESGEHQFVTEAP